MTLLPTSTRDWLLITFGGVRDFHLRGPPVWWLQRRRSREFGARIHMPDPILTDMPLIADGPIDLGVEDFCKICRKCASNCPTNSISFGPKVIYNGIEKYKINWLTCYRLRPYVTDFWESCLTCVAICPYTKPNMWWHHLAVGSLRTTPIPLRPWRTP